MTNLATAKALYDAFLAHDMPGIIALLDDDIEWNAYGPDFALAIGCYKGKTGVQNFFGNLIGPEGQQVDTLFAPLEYYEGGGSVHVIGIESGTLTKYVEGGALTGRTFYNNFDHTLWFSASGLIARFRANYNLALVEPPNWPPSKSAA